MQLKMRNQDALWKHMAKSCAVPLMSNDQYRQRKRLLEEAIGEVNDGSYTPKRVHGFLSVPKASSVGRFVPVLTCTDTAVYFACMQDIESKLASTAVEDTFGGWQLGNTRRQSEEQRARDLFEGCPSMPPSCYNRKAWMKEWQKYWKLLAARHEHSDDDSWFAMFDIANFYDSVDLRQLETRVRAISGDQHFAINVLFHLLGSWNRALSLYTPSTKGLPMDLVGDCSRLLANYFLTPFDRAFRSYALSKGADYMRFADDMVVRASSRDVCERLVFEASFRLHEIGLNINVAKVKYCCKEAFEKHWGFVIMDHFESGRIDEALKLLRRAVKEEGFGRKDTALKRAITLADQNAVGIQTRREIYDLVASTDLPLHLSKEQMLALMRLSGDFSAALIELTRRVLNQTFTQPKAILLQVLVSLRPKSESGLREVCEDGIREISNLNDSILQLALRNWTD